MRAVGKVSRARANKHSANFCEQFEQRPNFASTFKLNGTIRYPSFCISSLSPFFLYLHCHLLTRDDDGTKFNSVFFIYIVVSQSDLCVQSHGSCAVLSFPFLPCLVFSCPVVSVLSCPLCGFLSVLSCPVLFCPALPCLALPYPTLPYPTLPYPTLPYPTLPYHTLPSPTFL